MRIPQSLIVFTLAACPFAHATDLGVHAKVGALVSKPCNNTTEAFVAGVASHVALDYMIYGTTLFDDGQSINSDYLLPTGIINIVLLRQVYKEYKRTKNKKLLYGALGGIFPDFADMIYHELLDRDGYLFSWHSRRSTLLVREPPSLGASRRAANYNLLIGATVWQIKF